MNVILGVHPVFLTFTVAGLCSQPPLLSAMVYEIYSRTGDMDFARKSLPALLKEHHFWNSGELKVSSLPYLFILDHLTWGLTCLLSSELTNSYVNLVQCPFTWIISGFHSVTILDAEGCNCTLSRYYAMWNKPRPESSTIVYAL